MKQKVVILVMILCLIMGQVPRTNIVEASSGITERKFILLLMTESGLCESDATAAEAIKVACSKKIVKPTEKDGLSSKLTKEKAAVYLYRTDVVLNGSTHDKELYQNVLNKKRISDLSSMKKANRASVIKIYCKGIMVGYSNGYYVQSRKFKGSSEVGLSEAKTYIKRLTVPSKRKKISWDGQLIRTTNLPSNASSYSYVLASYPNGFYERKFEYQKTKYYKTPEALVDFASPVQIRKMTFYNGQTMGDAMDKYLDAWCKKVEQNIKLRFNVNYKTINNTWVNNLRKTYYVYEDDAQANKKRTDDIKEYVEVMKKEKVIVKTSRVTVEPSTLYNCGKDYVRVYVKFKVVSGDCENLTNSLYSDGVIISGIRKNQWKECYFDIGIGTVNATSNGSDYSIVENLLIDIK